MIVDRVRNLLLLKLVSFRAPKAEWCDWNTIVGGHSLTMITRRVRVEAGETITVPIPFWRNYEIGQTVDLGTIVKLPFAPRGDAIG